MSELEAQDKILLVDDARINLEILQHLLDGRGYVLRVAKSGEEALRLARREHPDLLLLDIMMPGLDGFEVCRRLKADPETRDSVVIFMSALSETNSKVKGLEVGAVDYITKPFESPEVLARVHAHLTIRRLQRSLAEKNEALGRANASLRSVLGRYVSREVAQSILDSPEGLDLGGEEREITILMSDLRGFTGMAAGLSPKDVLASLNIYLETMVEVIERYRGTIIEILGDAFLVMYGAPLAQHDHADRAVASALAMQQAMASVNARLAEHDWPPLDMGIGVHTGRCVVGNIGSHRRTKYAAVGTAVNLAGRIESFTVGGQVLVSEATQACLRAKLAIRSEMMVKPKGVAPAVRLFVVSGIGPPYSLSLPEAMPEMHALIRPVPVTFSALQEKAVSATTRSGRVVALAEREARIASETLPAELENLSVHFLDSHGAEAGEAYAKVVHDDDAAPRTFRVWFTALAPQTATWLREQRG